VARGWRGAHAGVARITVRSRCAPGGVFVFRVSDFMFRISDSGLKFNFWNFGFRASKSARNRGSQGGPSGAGARLFRGGLVFKAHRLLYHSTLGLRVIKKKKKGAPLSRPRTGAVRTGARKFKGGVRAGKRGVRAVERGARAVKRGARVVKRGARSGKRGTGGAGVEGLDCLICGGP